MFKINIRFLAVLCLALLAAPAIGQQGRPLELAQNAPDRYTVRKGDTLWGISSKFLKEPWRWPEIWRLNREQIRNPHLIYPGDVIVLDRAGLRLGLDTKLSPRIRAEALPPEAIPAIPANVIEPWLSRPLVIERGGLDNAPRIVATEEGRYNLGSGGRAYVEGIGDSKEPLWDVYRQGRPLTDPDTNQVLAWEAVYLGTARVVKPGEPSTIHIIDAVQEVTVGDRLIPADRTSVFSYAPHAPDKPINGRVIAIYGARGDAGMLTAYSPGLAETRLTQQSSYDAQREAGPLQIVSINRGARDGVERGHVLAISRADLITFDRSVGPFYLGHDRPENVQLPKERYGLLLIFRTFDQISYGLIVQGERPLRPGDLVTTP